MDPKKLTVVTELHKLARRYYSHRRVVMRGIDETCQADFIEIVPYFRKNKGFKYLLTVIYISSKYTWAIPVQSKTGKDMATEMKSILVQDRIPQKLHADKVKEFYDSKFESSMES